MGIETQPGDVYRLIVAFEARVVEGADCRYRHFEQAQARVAETVCRYARAERVRAVAVQRGRPNQPIDRGGNGSPASAVLDDSDYDWKIEKRWGTEVIQRILLQNGVAPPATIEPFPTDEAVGPPAATGRATDSTRVELPRPAGKHKSTRWPVTAAIAIVVLAIIAMALFQVGGHPSRLLSAITGAKLAVKDELPFDARTSFALEPQPAAHESSGKPSGETTTPATDAQP